MHTPPVRLKWRIDKEGEGAVVSPVPRVCTPPPTYNTRPTAARSYYASGTLPHLSQLLSLGVATPKRKNITPKLSSICKKITHKVPKAASQGVSPPHKGFLVGRSSPFMRFAETSPNTSQCFALGARDVCLVGENSTFSVPALNRCEGLWPYEYGYA